MTVDCESLSSRAKMMPTTNDMDQFNISQSGSDFFIGGFASAKCDAIITGDQGIYQKYFPNFVGYENCLA